jgi:hypothetical protein
MSKLLLTYHIAQHKINLTTKRRGVTHTSNPETYPLTQALSHTEARLDIDLTMTIHNALEYSFLYHREWKATSRGFSPN